MKKIGGDFKAHVLPVLYHLLKFNSCAFIADTEYGTENYVVCKSFQFKWALKSKALSDLLTSFKSSRSYYSTSYFPTTTNFEAAHSNSNFVKVIYHRT